MSEPSSVSVPFIRKKNRPTNARKRSATPPSGVASTSQVVLPTRKVVANPLVQGTKRTYLERETDGPDVQWKSAGSQARAEAGMTLALEEELERSKKIRSESKEDELDDGLYKGQSGYRDLIKKREDGVPKAMRTGPVRNTSTIRTVTIIDYQPDVCKDYKETGYCGFGDTCKFLHDRGTYLQGWQLDNVVANASAKQIDSVDSDSDEDIPWACYICRKPYTDPVVTRCLHYFCSACAIKRFAKTPKCAACAAPTGGIFNRADKVIQKMQAKRDAKEGQKGEEADAPSADSGVVELEGLGEEENDDSE